MSRLTPKSTVKIAEAPSKEGKVTTSLRLNPDHLRRVRELATKKGVLPSAIIQIAIAEFLEKSGQ